MKKTSLSLGDKILIVVYELSQGTTKILNYEDIVVAAWKKFPQDFSMRNYPYPDALNIQRPLYQYERMGFVRGLNRRFALTEHGLDYVQNILPLINMQQQKSQSNLSRNEQIEIEKLLKSDAFKLYENGEKEKILDSDIYAFYGATVRTGKNEFMGRISTVNSVIENARRVFSNNMQIKILQDLNKDLLNDEKFKDIIPFKSL